MELTSSYTFSIDNMILDARENKSLGVVSYSPFYTTKQMNQLDFTPSTPIPDVLSKQLTGRVFSSLTLTPTMSPYTIVGRFAVPTGATLIIMPNVTVYYSEFSSIFVNGGQVIANATNGNKIFFRGNSPSSYNMSPSNSTIMTTTPAASPSSYKTANAFYSENLPRILLQNVEFDGFSIVFSGADFAQVNNCTFRNNNNVFAESVSYNTPENYTQRVVKDCVFESTASSVIQGASMRRFNNSRFRYNQRVSTSS